MLSLSHILTHVYASRGNCKNSNYKMPNYKSIDCSLKIMEYSNLTRVITNLAKKHCSLNVFPT